MVIASNRYQSHFQALIDASHIRTLEYNMDYKNLPSYAKVTVDNLQQRQSKKALMIQSAQTFIDHLFDMIQTTFIVALFDQDGVLLDTRGDRLPESLLKEHTVPGYCWDEKHFGTNAIGLALIDKQPIHIVGKQHNIVPLQENTCAASLIYGAQGEVIGGIAIAAHASEHSPYLLGMVTSTAHAIEKAYELKKDHYRVERILGKISNSPNQMVVIADSTGKMIYTNGAFLETIMLSTRMNINDIFQPHSALYRTLQEQRNFNRYEESFNDKHLSWDTYWMEDEYFEQGVLLGIGQDITMKIRMEGALKEQNRLKTMGLFSAQMAHEIRNPLATVNTAISLIKTKVAHVEGIEKRFNTIQSEIQRISHLTSHFLSISKPPEPVLSYNSLKETLLGLSYLLQSRIAQAELNLVEDFESEGYTSFDSDQLRQVLLNLYFNAIDATPSGGTLRLKLEEKESLFVITLQDNGIGIPEDRLQDIFEPFYTTKSKGIGLGLSNSKSIMEAHEGTLDIAPLKQGTCVTLTLPKREEIDDVKEE
jgi:two-component system, sporulation sensor kinase E